MGSFKEIVNTVSNPTILFTSVLILFPFVFPPTNWFEKYHRKFYLDKLWTNNGLLVMLGGVTLFLILGYTDKNAVYILTKPDNIPIIIKIFHYYIRDNY